MKTPGWEVEFLESHFPDAKFVFLPDSFTPMITALAINEINCSICQKKYFLIILAWHAMERKIQWNGKIYRAMKRVALIVLI
jgi:hypothetical protein